MSLMRKIMSILGIIISSIVNRRTDIFFSKHYILYIYDEPKKNSNLYLSKHIVWVMLKK